MFGAVTDFTQYYSCYVTLKKEMFNSDLVSLCDMIIIINYYYYSCLWLVLSLHDNAVVINEEAICICLLVTGALVI